MSCIFDSFFSCLRHAPLLTQIVSFLFGIIGGAILLGLGGFVLGSRPADGLAIIVLGASLLLFGIVIFEYASTAAPI